MSEAGRDDVACPCGHVFSVASSLRGGIANCPHCRQAVKISGGRDLVFLGLVGAASLVVLGATALAGWLGGALPALVTLGVGGALVVLGAVMS